jgi:hypothetical protein
LPLGNFGKSRRKNQAVFEEDGPASLRAFVANGFLNEVEESVMKLLFF